ncbi:P-loop containing nucleoside triphosphate hydrolase protein [Auriculariales sp. MPI-PUGE-AT-0066]|nr:P-loop containing nucleoside triphosphate hydrolase protein [Auriculariales sp. MPI-PUGE-AT-0066]
MARQLELAAAHIKQCLARIPSRPLFVGLQGPQGSGKTTLCSELGAVLAPTRCAVLSIDDLYLPHARLRALAAQFPDNVLLAGRGQPGTHDVALGAGIFATLRGSNGNVRLPAFDKSLHGGEGDRVDGPEVALPLDVVVVEGWCTGFYPLSAEELERRNAPPEIRQINEFLHEYAAQWWSTFHAFIQIAPDPPGKYDLVYKWRLEQEHWMKSTNGGRGMSDDQVIKFVDRYIPGYLFFGGGVKLGLGENQRPPWIGQGLQLVIDEQRKVVGSSSF